jgi:pimeloyl-ACP methyl ester carboxylesterase
MGLHRVALLANSFGCQVAVECAIMHPECVSHLILKGRRPSPRRERFSDS